MVNVCPVKDRAIAESPGSHDEVWGGDDTAGAELGITMIVDDVGTSHMVGGVYSDIGICYR